MRARQQTPMRARQQTLGASTNTGRFNTEEHAVTITVAKFKDVAEGTQPGQFAGETPIRFVTVELLD
jgi:hypothetical protein